MGNIIGEPFSQTVKSQVDTRQSALAESPYLGNINPDTLKYYTTKTPWLRLASSVNLKEDTNINSNNVLDKLVSAGIPKEAIVGDNLAKNFILQGGTVGVNDDGSVNFKQGLNYDNDIFSGAYGWGGIDERGFVPMPGITNANTTYYNNGALSKAVINITCFSRTQFALLDVLYLRPGYTLLLEFGWSTYLKSSSSLDEFGETNTDQSINYFDGFKSEPLNFLLSPGDFKGDKNQYKMLSLINEERQKHSYNYEAVYGKISTFKWSFNSDGSYNCEVTLIGMGSIIESLKLNITDPKKNDDGDTAEGFMTKEEWVSSFFSKDPDIGSMINQNIPITEWDKKLGGRNVGLLLLDPTNGELKANSKTEKINAWVDAKYSEIKKEEAPRIAANLNNNPLLSNKDETKLNRIFYNIYQDISSRAGDGYYMVNRNGMNGGIFMVGPTLNGETSADGSDKSDKSVYIKFALLLRKLEKICNLYSGTSKTKMIKFDFQYANMQKDENYMMIVPPNFSCNPGICLTEYSSMAVDGITYTDDIDTNTQLNNFLKKHQSFAVKDNPYIGRLGNVYLNLRFCAKALAESPIDDDGAISVLAYIKTILRGINESMGSINNFTVMEDGNTGYIKIYDETPKPGIITTTDAEFTKINIFGVKRNFQGSFVTNVNLDASIPQGFATMISIGAQQSGNNLQGNATSFSSYNAGLVDRIIPDKQDYYSSAKKEDVEDSLTKLKTIKSEKIYYATSEEKSKISPFVAVYGAPSNKAGGATTNTLNFTPSLCKDFTSNYSSYIKLVYGELSNKFTIPSPFFLPFNLSLEMEGISGMKLFQKFRISDDILPPSYAKDSIDIIVKGINHSIDVQKWSTTLDTMSVPRHNTPTEDVEDLTTATYTPNTKQKQLEAVAEEPTETNEDEDIKLRIVLTRVCDNGFQTLGIMEVLDEDGSLLYALPTTELPFLDNLSGKSCIPTGTYNVTSRISPKYGDCFIISELNNRGVILKTGRQIAGANDTDRGYILIHEAPAAQGNSKPWLLGCIAPGFVFNMNDDDKFGNPRGTGTAYGGKKSPSHLQSIEANKKIISTLWSVGKNPMFKIEIKSLGGGQKPMYTDFYAGAVQNFIEDLEDDTGEYYMDLNDLFS